MKNKNNFWIIILVIFLIIVLGSLIIYKNINSDTEVIKIMNIEKTDEIPKVASVEKIPDIKNLSHKLEVINHQLKYGREEILQLNCNIIQEIELNKYCLSEKNELDILNKAISWESVLHKWDDYILWFDCLSIYGNIWQEYCIKHQNVLKILQ